MRAERPASVPTPELAPAESAAAKTIEPEPAAPEPAAPEPAAPEPATPLDVERVICRVDALGTGGARGFAIGSGDWPLRGFVVRVGKEIRGYVNRCPHVGHPLNLLPHRFLTSDDTLILCSSHGALFEKLTGYCVAGPCAGQALQPLPLRIADGFVLLGDDVEPSAPADA